MSRPPATDLDRGDRNPLRGGLTGIALVAAATALVAVLAVIICAAALLLIG